jgi:hypothetical protein
MKAVAKFEDANGAFEAVDLLSQADVYACISGIVRIGYEVLVRDSQVEAAKQALALPPANAEETVSDVGGTR